MSGTIEGGLKTAATNKLKYGENYYRDMGRIGGAKGRGHAFGHGKVDPRVAGAKGGKISKRKSVVVEEEHKWYAKLKHTLKIK